MMNVHEQKMCELQGEAFAISAERLNCGSVYFIARFMNCELAKNLDEIDDPYNFVSPYNIVNYMKETYPGLSEMSGNKFPADVLKWIGSVYRAWAIIKKAKSWKIYKVMKANLLLSFYDSFHTFSLDYCVERLVEIAEQKTEQINAYQLYKEIRLGDKK